MTTRQLKIEKSMQIESQKQCIGGEVYDTTTAELIAWIYDNNIVDSDFEGIKRHLMRRTDGVFFMFSLFGTMRTRPISQIVPLTEFEAIRWCQSNDVGIEKTFWSIDSRQAEFREIAA